jgi:hypothetical protein
MIDVCKDRYAEDIEVNDELDLDGDEYGDNEFAIFYYAVVTDRKDFYQNKESWITLTTSQGVFTMPGGHIVKVKVHD